MLSAAQFLPECDLPVLFRVQPPLQIGRPNAVETHDAPITFSTFLVIFPKELGTMSRTGLVEWLDVLRRLW